MKGFTDQGARPPRLMDVAERAGVSVTTASVVLNGKAAQIPAVTQRRVQRAAVELGYRPNALARSLRLQRSMLVALISDDVATGPFAGAVIQGAQEAAWQAGLMLVVVDTHAEADREPWVIQELRHRQVDGFLYARYFHQVVIPPPEVAGTPTVMVDTRDPDDRFNSVVPDEVSGAYDAVMHLVEAGHERIGYLQNVDDIPATRLRLEGFRRALADAGIPFDRTLVVETVPHERVASTASARRLLERPDRPTGLFVFSDRAASGVYVAARDLGIRIPQDLSVVGFDNLELVAGLLEPGLTTMQLPHREMGRWAVEQLVQLIDDPDTPVRQQVMPCPLVERGSVASPPTS